MAIPLLVVGFVMNVLGVMIGSWRDLAKATTVTRSAVRAATHSVLTRLKALWRRLFGGRASQTFAVLGVADAVASGGSVSISVWPAIDDALSPEEKVDKLIMRTQTLHELHLRQSEHQVAATNRLTTDLAEVGARLTTSIEHLDQRIYDIDDKPVTQRAFGAVLVLCGTALMFAGGLMGA